MICDLIPDLDEELIDDLDNEIDDEFENVEEERQEEVEDEDALKAWNALSSFDLDGEPFLDHIAFYKLTSATTDAEIEQIVEDHDGWAQETYQSFLEEKGALCDWLQKFRDAIGQIVDTTTDDQIENIVANAPVRCPYNEHGERNWWTNHQERFAQILRQYRDE